MLYSLKLAAKQLAGHAITCFAGDAEHILIGYSAGTIVNLSILSLLQDLSEKGHNKAAAKLLKSTKALINTSPLPVRCGPIGFA